MSDIKLQTLNAGAWGLHPDRLRPRRDLKHHSVRKDLTGLVIAAFIDS